VFFVIIYNRFVDSSKCGPRDLTPRAQSKNSCRAPVCSNSRNACSGKDFA